MVGQRNWSAYFAAYRVAIGRYFRFIGVPVTETHVENAFAHGVGGQQVGPGSPATVVVPPDTTAPRQGLRGAGGVARRRALSQRYNTEDAPMSHLDAVE